MRNYRPEFSCHRGVFSSLIIYEDVGFITQIQFSNFWK